MAERDLDVVVLGATGVTGRRVAAYLAERAEAQGLRWAAAARDTHRLTSVLEQIGVSAPETVRADIEAPATLAELAQRTRVLLNLVGPYTRHGRPVVEACVAGGAHYADLTGELPFVRSIIDAFDAEAVRAGVKIVQVCGFEALPPDLATLLAAEAARERWEEPLTDVDVEVSFGGPPGLPRPSDAISGGTLQSMLAIASAEESATIADPAVLIGEPLAAAAVRRASPIPLAPRRGAGGGVLAPMAPAPFINPAVVHRTAALADAAAGRPPAAFRYREGLLLAGGPASAPLRWATAGALSATQVGLRGFARVNPAARRRVVGALEHVTPGSGFGPAADRLEAWTWRMSVRARTSGGHTVEVLVDADGHPGYLATARMLGEAGILLAETGATPDRAGCLTPAIALGSQSAPRFALAHVRFSFGA